MEFTTVTVNGVDPDQPMVFLIDIQDARALRRYVAASPSGARLPQIGFPWIVGRLLDDALDDPDWARRCDWIHFKMLEAWIFDRAVHLTFLENAAREDLSCRCADHAVAHDADLNAVVCAPEQIVAAVAELRQLALQDVLHAPNPAELRRASPQRWLAAVQAHATAADVTAEAAEQHLRTRLG